MNPQYSAQHVLCCGFCQDPDTLMYCDPCRVYMCNACVGSHVSEFSHEILPLKHRGSHLTFPSCRNHSTIQCDVFCELCDMALCVLCASSTVHVGHTLVDTLKKFQRKKDLLRKDLEELEIEKEEMDKPMEKNLDEADYETIEGIKLSKLKQAIRDLNELLVSNDVHQVSMYKSRNELSTEEVHLRLEDESDSSRGHLLVTPKNIATINTGLVFSVAWRSDEEIWTRGEKKYMKLYNLEGNLLKSIQTRTGNVPEDIAVTKTGNLVYTDFDDSSVNIVLNEDVQKKITLDRWRPRNICCTSSGDLLVIMDSDDETQSKVVRFSNFAEVQTIQRDDHNLPLYSSGAIKYINENGNFDICVADNLAGAIVIVNQAGKLRFKYTGHTKPSFRPAGITTDTQRRILTADCGNHCIHILNQDGLFLRYIENVGLKFPCGLCLDSKDNLFVATQRGFAVLRYCINTN